MLTSRLHNILVKVIIIAFVCVVTTASSLMMLISWASDRTEKPLYMLGFAGFLLFALGGCVFARAIERNN